MGMQVLLAMEERRKHHGKSFEGIFKSVLPVEFAGDSAVLRRLGHLVVVLPDLALFVNLSDAERPDGPEDVSTFTLIPAFIVSELKTAFQIGFMIYVPFIVIDMIVASTLMSMGMMMLPPVMISLPFKILLFVMVDGWHLLIKSLIVSFK